MDFGLTLALSDPSDYAHARGERFAILTQYVDGILITRISYRVVKQVNMALIGRIVAAYVVGSALCLK